ncbi:MAG: manganese efflux pump MntP family protein [Lachnospiraceae bacterium]|nr:manganese efflux pump MntP family protein [Lachnospiraceae bacterium]
MTLLEIFLTGVGLSMDAFAISVCKGLLTDRNDKIRCALVCGLWFGGFQFLMPLLGYTGGSFIATYLEAVDHWIAFILLILIGGNMIRESFSEEDENETASLRFGEMLLLAIATSIDALAVGLTLATLKVSIVPACSVIGITTFAISFAGVIGGSFFGNRLEKYSRITGGIILIVIGLRILISGLMS